MASFSQRRGLVPLSSIIQRDTISAELRSGIWNVLFKHVWDNVSLRGRSWRGTGQSALVGIYSAIWTEFFKKPIDDADGLELGVSQDVHQHIRHFFFNCPWNRFYDFLEFLVQTCGSTNMDRALNDVLALELSAYRLVAGEFCEITSPEEIAAVDRAAESDTGGAAKHIQSATALLASRDSPDYRNSIKESISAVESLCQLVTGDPSATLGQAIKKMPNYAELHPALIQAFDKLYGYTSNE